MNAGEALTKLGAATEEPVNRIRGDLIVITGPSGVGKGTLVERVIERVDHLKQSVSVTTRPMREGEKEGQSYFFRTREQFDDMVAKGEFMEWAEFAGQLYGTPRDWVCKAHCCVCVWGGGGGGGGGGSWTRAKT